MFDDKTPSKKQAKKGEKNNAKNAPDPAFVSFGHELASNKEHLQTNIEELETAKEEIQSTNEELITVNTEL